MTAALARCPSIREARKPRLLVHLACGAVCALALAHPAVQAQDRRDEPPRGERGRVDSGQFQILHASYGTLQRNVDVTHRLKELARRDRSFRMGNDTFGIDPDFGHVKALRIYTRSRDGQERIFQYPEGSVVDGALFTGWSGGDWGHEARRDDGEFSIVQAQYGTEGHRVDVTQRLRELARADRRVRMGNDTFGIDPDPGRVKTLRIFARGRDGQMRSFDYIEGSVVDGALYTGWGGGGEGRR